jgi:hypothetical protein
MIYAVCKVVQLLNSIFFCSTFGNVLVTGFDGIKRRNSVKC